MGIFGIFKKKEDAHIVHDKLTHFKGAVLQSFAHLRRDMDVQKQWVNYLNNIHTVLKSAHDKHRELTNKDFSDLKNWIRHLNTNARRHEDNMKSLEKNLKSAMNSYNKHMVELYNRMHKSQTREVVMRKEILSEVKQLIQEKHKESHDSIEGHVKAHVEKQVSKHISARMQKITPEVKVNTANLTNPEQKLLNLLMAESDPVSYSHIAEKTGNSINTVRVIMNNLKKRGLIEEHTLPNGTKLFNSTNKEKIKKLYNIDHL